MRRLRRESIVTCSTAAATRTEDVATALIPATYTQQTFYVHTHTHTASLCLSGILHTALKSCALPRLPQAHQLGGR